MVDTLQVIHEREAIAQHGFAGIILQARLGDGEKLVVRGHLVGHQINKKQVLAFSIVMISLFQMMV